MSDCLRFIGVCVGVFAGAGVGASGGVDVVVGVDSDVVLEVVLEVVGFWNLFLRCRRSLAMSISRRLGEIVAGAEISCLIEVVGDLVEVGVVVSVLVLVVVVVELTLLSLFPWCRW